MLKEVYRKFTDIVFVNLLWILVSFLGLFVTVGAATTAMFTVTFQVLKKNEPTNVFSSYIKSFKDHFVASTLVWLFLVLAFIPLYMMYHYGLNQNITWLTIIAIVGFYQLLIFTLYVFPVMAVFKTKSTFQLMKNVIIMANTNLWTNIKIIGSLSFVVLLVVLIHESMLLIGVGIYGILVSHHLNIIFRPIYRQLGVLDEEGEIR
jgi:uncharacterized membrane protein YesL